MNDVAAAAGVSHGTVSHALNHPDRVSAEKLRKVQEAAERLGFVRNESARQLRSGTSNTLGLILLDTWDPFYTELTRGFEDVAIANGRNVVVANSALSVERETANLELFEQRRLQGILILPQSPATFPLLERIRNRGTSCVLVDQPPAGFDLPSVSVDDFEGGVLAGRHLVGLGRRRVLFVGNPAVFSHTKDRLEGLRSVAGPASAEVDIFEVGHLDFDRGVEAGEYVLSRDPAERPDAVFCANDMLALGLMQVFAGAGIPVPRDIAIVGYDDIGFAAQVATPLTTVRQPAYQLGATAGEVLLRDIKAARTGEIERIVYTPVLVPRASTLGSKRTAKTRTSSSTSTAPKARLTEVPAPRFGPDPLPTGSAIY